MNEGRLLLAWPGLRARAYLQAMARARLLPDTVVLLGPPQADATDPAWGHPPTPIFDPGEPLRATLQRAGLTPVQAAPCDVNAPAVVDAVRCAGPRLAVFSGGGILRQPMLDAASRWLHVHPGRLPEHRGSTCIYYSLLLEGQVSASAFFMGSALDQGQVVSQRSFGVPSSCGMGDLDHVFDAWIRATVLVDALAALAADAAGGALAAPEADSMLTSPRGPGYEFTVIHPVLKHLAVASLPHAREGWGQPEDASCR